MRLSVAITYDSLSRKYSEYSERKVVDLIRKLQRASLVVGFDLIRTQYQVLHGYTTLDLTDIPTLDLKATCAKKLPGVELADLAWATLGIASIPNEYEAVRWFCDGKTSEVVQHCRRCVQIVRSLHQYGLQHQHFVGKRQSRKKGLVKIQWDGGRLGAHAISKRLVRQDV